MIKKGNVLIFLARLAEVYPIGHVKKAPGTFASFISLFIGYYLINLLGIFNFIIFLIIFSIIGFIISEIHVRVFKQKDPKEVVIDEFTGQFIALLAITSSNNTNDIILSISLSFLLFRFFDITKLGPIKKFEKLPGGIGIMADDIVAGICAFLVQCGIMTAFNQQLLIKVY
ncbi:phosphatidylglycerophosphatase A [Alphaproteobacteria bacterium]|nr:phosphatidylglycerophosphatase A [Alphaproteobacteria bacterium]